LRCGATSRFLQRPPAQMDVGLFVHGVPGNSNVLQHLQMLDMSELNHQLELVGLFSVSSVHVQTRSPAHVAHVMNSSTAIQRVLNDDGGVVVNDWAEISQSIVSEVVDFGGEDFQILGYAAGTTFAIIDAVRNKESWDTTIINVGSTLLPIVSTVNPVLGFGLGIFMSLFGIGSSQAKAEEALN